MLRLSSTIGQTLYCWCIAAAAAAAAGVAAAAAGGLRAPSIFMLTVCCCCCCSWLAGSARAGAANAALASAVGAALRSLLAFWPVRPSVSSRHSSGYVCVRVHVCPRGRICCWHERLSVCSFVKFASSPNSIVCLCDRLSLCQ